MYANQLNISRFWKKFHDWTSAMSSLSTELMIIPLPVLGLKRPQSVFKIWPPSKVWNFALKYVLVGLEEEASFGYLKETLDFVLQEKQNLDESRF